MSITFPNYMTKRKFEFADSNVEAKFRKIMSPTGPIVLTELRDMLIEAGVEPEVFRDVEPRSVFAPEMLDAPMSTFFGEKSMNFDVETYEMAWSRVSEKFRSRQKVVPISFDAAVGKMDLSKSAGLPTLRPKVEVLEKSLAAADQCWRGKCPPPSVVFHRGKNLEVARPVHGLPFEWHLVEARFFYPLHEALSGYDSPYSIHLTRTELVQKLNWLDWHSTARITLDYSGFDGSVSAKLIGDAFNILRRSMMLTSAEERVFARVASWFATCPMLCPDGYVYSGRRGGVPSGSMFTQLVDSIINALVIEYLAIKLDFTMTRYHVTGDDSAIGVKGSVPKLNNMRLVALTLGISISERKSTIVKDNRVITYLGHFSIAVASRMPSDTFCRIVTPERADSAFWSKDKSIRYSRYAQIIRGHMLDNRLAWKPLLRVLEVLEGRRNQVCKTDTWTQYLPAIQTKAAVDKLSEKARWNFAIRRAMKEPRTDSLINAVLMMT